MADLSNEYTRILSEIENSISNESERKVVKEKVGELSMLFIENIENLNNVINNKLKEIEERENRINNIVNQLQRTVNEIEEDIYENDESEDGNFDFEIVCPYCNTEFVTDLSMLNLENSEIKCPECNNIIELDWNEEDDCGCSGDCMHGCHGCGHEHYDEESEDLEQNDDDM